MSTANPDRAQPAQIARAEAETLAAKLVTEMIQRWRQGERLLVEHFLTRHPELLDHPAAVADLIYEELCLRQESGLEVAAEEMLLRFPQWRPQLQVLFDCQRILGPRRAAPQFPAVGEFLGDFLLLAELGGGAHGRVFLASQLSLGDRPVVLKLTACDSLTACQAHEHLSLARLQHTHIVPLYSVQDYPGQGLRALCMPFFGGATLAQLLQILQPQPPSQRTGQSFLDALDRLQAALIADCKLELPGNLQSGIVNLQSRRALAGATYVQAVCWITACLADALQYAHERGLVHLDLKPSNVLLAADGQPMLLDFHLAREPIHLDGTGVVWLGGTAGYMSPEQQAALLAIEQGRRVTVPVDGRSDIYSLGIVLYEALGGTMPIRGGKPRPLHLCNGQVSMGLSDVVSKCLAGDPEERYPSMGALAGDLRRHLANLPLSGVRNRSVIERWRKWQRRRPHGMALTAMLLAVLTAAGGVAFGTVRHFTRVVNEASAALETGQRLMAKKEWDWAISTLNRGLDMARGLPFPSRLAHDLEDRLRLAEGARADMDRAATADRLHRLMNRIRFLYEAEHLPPDGLRELETSCRTLWEKRAQIADGLESEQGTAPEPVVCEDLLELAIFRGHLAVRLAPPGEKDEAHRRALAILQEAEDLFGTNPVLDEERKMHSRSHASRGAPAAGLRVKAAPTPAWQHYALGRALLRSGDLEKAITELKEAVALQPQGLWPNFYFALCAYRLGHHLDAVAAYSLCIGTAPEPAGCLYNRARAFEALGCTEQALQDYNQALRLDPSLSVAALNRGMLHYRAKRYVAAIADLQRAAELGADSAVVLFDLALVNLARGERAAALKNLTQCLAHNPQQPDARKLYDSLVGR